MRLAEITPDEGRALALLYALPGALGGLALWALVEVQEPGAVAAGLLAFVIPLVAGGIGAWTLVTTPGDRGRSAAFAGALGVLLGALSWSAWRTAEGQGLALAGFVLPMIGWIALAFYRSYQETGRPAAYPALFAGAWNLPVVLGVAGAFTGAAYGVSWLLAAMFRLIGLPVLTDLLSEPSVSSALIGGLGAAGIGVVRRQEAILLTLRGVVIALLRVLAPVFALGTLLFSLALLVQGLDSLWEGWSPVVLIVLTTAAGVVFVNAVVQDQGAARGLLGLCARVQCFVLPVLAGLAAWGMGVRIAEHGLTPDRIVAAIIAGAALLYALAYALAAATGWTVLRSANVGLAGALALTGAYVLTPAFQAQAWSVASQLARLERGAVSPEAFDVAALRFDLGEPGMAALERLAAGEGVLAERAQVALVAEFRFDANLDAVHEDAKARYLAKMLVRPAGTDLPEGLANAMKARLNQADLTDEAPSDVILLMPGYAGERDAAIWVSQRDGRAVVALDIFVAPGADAPIGAAGDWRMEAARLLSQDDEEAVRAYMERVRTAPFGPVTVPVVAPSIDGEPLLPRPSNVFVVSGEPEAD